MKLFLSGDVMTGRGVDQILRAPCDPAIDEPWMKSALDYVLLAERSSGPIPRGVEPAYVWGEALAELERELAHVLARVGEIWNERRDARGPRGARRVAAAGIDRVVALELHSPALESAFPMRFRHLLADPVLLPAARARPYAIVSPDAGGLKRAQRLAAALGAPLAVVAKLRPSADVALPLQVLGEVRGADCLIVDDMASTGRTAAGAAQALAAAGAREVHAMFVHAVMAPGALERIRAAGVRRIVTTDSVRAVDELGVEVISCAPLFAEALS